MNKEMVIVVPTEAAAYEVVKALKGLDLEGSIELYSFTVVTKGGNGGGVSIKDTEHLHAPWGTLLGLSTGALIGLIGGPVGAAVGAAIGGAAGLGGDLAYSGFAGDFVYNVTERLEPGSHAVCASIWEDWTAPIDIAVAPFGAVVLRQATDDLVFAQIQSDMRALNDELDHIDAEIARATGDAKKKLETKREELRAKQTAQREKLKARAKKLEDTWDAELASIDEKARKAQAAAKARHEQHTQKLARFSAAQKQAFHDLFA